MTMDNQTSGKPGILIVDDDPSGLRALNRILSDDYRLFVTKSGKEALELAASESPELIMLSTVIDEMDGFEVIKRLKSDIETTNIPIILIMSLSSGADEEKGLLFGAADYITKPFLDVVVRARVKTQINSLRQSREIERLSMNDELTGIPNRRSFDLRLAVEWSRAIREHGIISLLLINIDNLGMYNNKFGYTHGDLVLQTVADIVHSSAKRALDITARTGGDEFAVALPNTELQPANKIAHRILMSVETAHIVTGGGIQLPVTASIGVTCTYPAAGDSMNDFVNHAAVFLKKAKSNGRNQVCCDEEG